MKRMLAKSLVIHMMGVIFSGYTLYSFSPFAIGYFGAINATDIIRWPAIIIMGATLLFKLERMAAIKTIIMMATIGIVVRLSETDGKKNTNPYFSAAVSGLVLIALEMVDTMLGTYDYRKIVMNVAAGVLAFSVSVIFAKALDVLTIPDGELVSKKKTQRLPVAERSHGKLDRFAKSLDKLSRSIDDLTVSADYKDDYLKGVLEENTLINDEKERLNRLWKGRIEESRKAVAVQLKEMAFMINEFSKEEYEFQQMEYEREHYIKVKLRARGITLKRLALLRNRRGITEIVITVQGKKGKIVTIKEFMHIIEEAVGKSVRPVGEYRKLIGSEEYTYNFTEETNFLVVHGSAKAVKGEESISGDNFAFMELGNGQALMSLSDGMGSGFSAYRDSEMVIELLEELLDCGFSEEVAIRLINSVFIVNSEKLRPTTVDMGIIDMYSGVCDFVKLGAASTFVKRGSWVDVIKSTSLPMGVFDKPDMESTSKKLYNGDYVIMVSDGILDSIEGEDKEKELGQIILGVRDKKPKEIADSILEQVIKKNNNEIKDDMTVLVCGIWDRCA